MRFKHYKAIIKEWVLNFKTKKQEVLPKIKKSKL